MSGESMLSDQPQLVQLALQGVLVLLGLYLLIAFLRLFTQSGLESRVRSYDGGGRREDEKRGDSRSAHGAASADTPTPAAATVPTAGDD